MSSPKKFTAKIHRRCSEAKIHDIPSPSKLWFLLCVGHSLTIGVLADCKNESISVKKKNGSSPIKITENLLVKQLSNKTNKYAWLSSRRCSAKFSVAVDGRKKSQGQPPFGCFFETLVNNGDCQLPFPQLVS